LTGELSLPVAEEIQVAFEIPEEVLRGEEPRHLVLLFVAIEKHLVKELTAGAIQ